VSGGSVIYTLIANNSGPDAAERVEVRDDLPAQVTFETVVPPAGWSCTTPPSGPGGAVTCAAAEIPSQSSARLLLSARLSCAVPDGTMISNAAVATSSWDPQHANDTAAVSVRVSNPPPAVGTVSVDRPLLWPPNHKMVDVTVGYDVTDNCDPTPACALSVTSSEPVNGPGDGNTSPDWVVVDAHSVQLRAERSGGGSGRLYRIAIACTDSAGHVGTASTTVSVPHSAP